VILPPEGDPAAIVLQNQLQQQQQLILQLVSGVSERKEEQARLKNAKLMAKIKRFENRNR